ncbi:QWRF motif-containing protein 2 [Malania oleifera]|uniref:QWRF motif-containing protein 2 n=1 Tax=Malania oleifera TaxID=397392 RepID=UPI0025ADFF7E|nr:QWRF motif-containing protein 2 [Malania oleifera]XP_057964378.1 QWRF motif-containing protein 2 [Malania oleifera]XP_057964379.1 QWRF motif-containing protein 2 [Malania oleifera]
MMVAAISEAASNNPQNPKAPSHGETLRNPRRTPFLDNGVGPRKPKSREVPSRYLSPSPSTSTSSSSSSSRRCSSPLVSRTTNTTFVSTPFPASTSASSALKRSQSADRRRPATSRPTRPLPESRICNGSEISAATKLLFTSTRSLSVSFQGEAFSLPISKTKAAPPPNLSRKSTPERRRIIPLRGKVDGGGGDQVENSKPNDHRWPGKTRPANPLSMSLDCTGDKKKLIGSGVGVRALKQSLIDETRRASFDGRMGLDLGNAELLKGFHPASDTNSVPSDITASDSDSVSSGSTSGVQECNGVGQGRSMPRGIVVSARFWQETNSRLRRLQDPGSPLSTSPASRMAAPPRFLLSKKFPSDGALPSPRAMLSPAQGVARPASPSKISSLALSPSRGIPSPSRARNAASSALSSNSGSAPSVFSFPVDVRRGKMGDNRIIDAHLLRLLYNRHLQWHFVNARAEAATFMQKLSMEKSLWNASITISDLRKSVRGKRIELQLLKQKLKLTSILKGQMTYLEEWALVDRENSIYLMGAIEALEASTLRLPIVGGAIADIQSMKEAVGSAVDVMKTMASSICSLLSKVEEANSLATELANVTAKEQALLNQCKDFLLSLAAMQVKDCSLRAHTLQLNRGVPTP